MSDPDQWRFGYDRYEPEQEERGAVRARQRTLRDTRAAADCLADVVHHPGTYLAGGYDH